MLNQPFFKIDVLNKLVKECEMMLSIIFPKSGPLGPSLSTSEDFDEDVCGSMTGNENKETLEQALALTVVSIGVAVATVTDLQFHLFGACVALAWIVPSAVNKILWLMWKTTPITLIFLAAMLPCLDPPGVLSFNWNFSNTLVIFTSAILGFLLQWSGALALG
ncbi:putative membrane protein [Sesbania bispinosa]|nr:putative membrane protein [Sesbania bispinosa]